MKNLMSSLPPDPLLVLAKLLSSDKRFNEAVIRLMDAISESKEIANARARSRVPGGAKQRKY